MNKKIVTVLLMLFLVTALASREEFEEKTGYFLAPDYSGKPLDSEQAGLVT